MMPVDCKEPIDPLSTVLSKAGSDDFASSFACTMAASWSQPGARKRTAMIVAHGGPAWRA
jgi:hypothetical protein